jgi:cobalt/nickel transport system permease protein
MANIIQSLYNINLLDELAEKKTAIHNIHPLAKLLTTIVFLVVTVSFEKYQVSRLFPLVLYPVIVMVLGEIPTGPILKRMLVAAPFVFGIGAFNPLLDKNTIAIFSGIEISAGWVSFGSLLVKCGLTVVAALLLISTTGMARIGLALRMIRVPKVFVMQLLLTYRYISVLIKEVSRTVQAYTLRSPFEKGIRFRAWGSLAGHLLLKTFDRAERVYQSMRCRGFEGEYHAGPAKKIMLGDVFYFTGWTFFFVLVRFINIPALIGSIATGVGK